jgi:hypothetical protein
MRMPVLTPFARASLGTGNERGADLAIGDADGLAAQRGEVALLDGREEPFMSMWMMARGQ